MRIPAAARLLLVSNSRSYRGGYLDHCAEAIRAFLGTGVRRVLFLPYAVADREAYAASTRERFASLGYELVALPATTEARAAVRAAEALFVGGGNTFRLLWWLERLRLIPLIRRRVLRATPYLGASAGVNVACPTIRTTNDMPILEPQSLDALGLIPFQINPHYLDADPSSTHMGETRETRIREFLEENAAPVVGLREGAWLRIESGRCCIEGETGARLFRRGFAPLELAAPAELDISSW